MKNINPPMVLDQKRSWNGTLKPDGHSWKFGRWTLLTKDPPGNPV